MRASLISGPKLHGVSHPAFHESISPSLSFFSSSSAAPATNISFLSAYSRVIRSGNFPDPKLHRPNPALRFISHFPCSSFCCRHTRGAQGINTSSLSPRARLIQSGNPLTPNSIGPKLHGVYILSSNFLLLPSSHSARSMPQYLFLFSFLTSDSMYLLHSPQTT